MNWTPRLAGRNGPTYRAIADSLAEDVQSGALPPGSRLPPHRELAQRLKVTVGTVSRAYAEAQRLGLVTGEVGRGSFVANGGEFSTLGDRQAVRPEVVDFSLNYPASAGMEDALVRDVLSTLGKRASIRDLLGYQHDGATPQQRAAAAVWLGHSDLTPAPDEIILTCGAQHALTVALASVCEAGDTVATEALSYPGIRALSIMHGFRLKPLPMDEHGLIPDGFNAACETTNIRALYVIPTIHNPTTATIPLRRRKAIAEIAERNGVTVVEDDVYGSSIPDRPPSIASMAPEQTIYVTSTSKFLVPGLRVGFAIPPRRLLTRLAAMVRTTVWMPPPPMLETFRIMVEQGAALRLARARIAETQARQAVAAKLLAGQKWSSQPHASHIWLKLPLRWSEYAFVGQARRRGVLLLSSESFALTRHAGEGHIRVCIGCPPSRSEMSRGLEIIRDMLSEDPDLHSGLF